MWDNIKWLENILQLNIDGKTIKKILSLQKERAVPKGENYTSEIYRITLEVVLGSGRIVKKSFIFKAVPDIKFTRQLALTTGIFHTEIKVFNTVFHEMERLMENAGDWRDPLWSECFAADITQGLLFQDLQQIGYRLTNRKEGVDVTHAKLVLSGLARFHAMSVILYENYIIRKEEFSKFYLANVYEPMIQKFVTSGMETFGNVIIDTWPKEWNETGKRIKATANTCLDKMNELAEYNDATLFRVLNHGDPWINNIMFKYDLETDQVCGVRFIDYQLCHWNSPAFDLHYFFSTSINHQILATHYDEFLRYYHSVLLKTFKLFKHEPKIVINLEQFRKEMERTTYFSFYSTVLILPLRLADKADAMDLEEVFKQENNDQEKIRKPYMVESYTNHIMKLFPEYKAKGFF